MGRVYLASDTVLGRKVAIKVLRDDLGLSKDTREHLDGRLRIEARAVAAVSHPNVVVLHDMGDDPEVGLYLVFEYVAGESLRARISNGPLLLEDVARLALELGSALDAAHEASVLHRDVKPENIFLARNGSKIGDFGIARVPDASVTKTGMGVVGTPAYAAPETLRGKSADLGPRSDQFSLAATLYEAITGRRAFPGEDLLSVAAAIGAHTPVATKRDELSARASERLDMALIARGMAKDPAMRFRSCGELGEAVAVALSGAHPTPASGGARKRPPRGLQVLVAVTLLAVVGIVLVERKSSHGPPSAPSQEVPSAPAAKPKLHPKAPHKPVPTAPVAPSSPSTALDTDANLP
jgi:eukaryotic-like serine/threonine-protein kinase